MRRHRLVTYLIAAVTLTSGALIFTTPGAKADTATPDVAAEGWFARNRPPSAQADTCLSPTSTLSQTTTRPCGPVGAPAYPTPQAKATGAYVVATAGGDAGDDASSGGDTGWAAFQWDLAEWSGATATKFEVSIAQLADQGGFNQGDTWKWDSKNPDQTPASPPPIQACNILEYWGSENGSNPWDGRPTDSAACVVPKTSVIKVNLNGTETTTALFTFDVTSFAQSWIDGTGFGMVIKPGTPLATSGLRPFQLTFSGYYDPGTAHPSCNVSGTTTCTTTPRAVPPPKVTFSFEPPVEDDFDDGGFGDIDTGGEEFFEDITTPGDEGVLEAIPDIDVIPTDEGSEPLPDEIAAPVEEAAPSSDIGGGITRPISRDTGFPWIVLLLLPLVVVAFWGTGTALGPLGEPVPARRGGVSRVLAQRQAANGGSHLHTR